MYVAVSGPQSVAGSSGNSSEEVASDDLIARMINSNEGWGKRPVHQDTPWEVAQTPEPPLSDSSGAPAPGIGIPGPQDMSGMYWNDGSGAPKGPAANGEWDSDIGVWCGPPGSAPPAAGADLGGSSWGIPPPPKDAWQGGVTTSWGVMRGSGGSKMRFVSGSPSPKRKTGFRSE